MEESRSRVTEPRQLIIEAPSVLTLKDRIAEVGVTLFFWLLLLYLWQPVLSFLAWMFQGYVSYRHMFSLGGYRAVLDILQSYVSYIGLMTGLLFVWAFYNQLRFGGMKGDKNTGHFLVGTCVVLQCKPRRCFALAQI
ncbi:MAG: poly-beta-1,6-N-acetyl-D-glucosamine biosynthesis protein PgaD [Cellvibrionales bacterium]|nr:poly-beta-1,6-N-acetyl-D-glucosamine biosynthesis protein PgaD [Cellvibrionales bacterium]